MRARWSPGDNVVVELFAVEDMVSAGDGGKRGLKNGAHGYLSTDGISVCVLSKLSMQHRPMLLSHTL